MTWVYGVLIFYAGVSIGYVLRVWLQYRTSYNGIIIIGKDEGKTVYSLILDDYPDKIEFRKEVILKVVSDIESPVASET
jgi:hypothetical protein